MIFCSLRLQKKIVKVQRLVKSNSIHFAKNLKVNLKPPKSAQFSLKIVQRQFSVSELIIASLKVSKREFVEVFRACRLSRISNKC